MSHDEVGKRKGCLPRDFVLCCPVSFGSSPAHFLRNWKIFGKLARALVGGVVKILVIFRFISSMLAMGDVSDGVLRG